MLTLAHATAASWLDAGSLSRLVGRNSRADVLVLGCSAAEVELFEAHRPRRIDCVSADAEDLEDAAATAIARGIVIEVHGAPPRAAYDLVPITHTITRACICPCPCPYTCDAPVLVRFTYRATHPCYTCHAQVLVAPRHLHTQPQLVPALKAVAGMQRRLVTATCQPLADAQPPCQPPATNRKRSATSRLPPATGHQPPVTSHLLLATTPHTRC